MTKTLFWLLLGVVVGYLIGHRVAHIVVATECERLGGFFVGKQVFKCVKVKDVD